MGFWYTVLGTEYDRVLAVQAFFGPVTILLTWLLARRLVGPRWALVAAFAVAVYPNAWQVEVRLFPDGMATVLTLLVLLSFLGLEPTRRRAAVTGLLLGLTMLARPSSVLLAAGIAVAYWMAAGARRGTEHLAVAALATVLVIAPWTIRNAIVIDGFVPLSVQDAAISGTFNDTAANDPVYPYAWRPIPERDRDIAANPRPEIELYHELRRRAREYISEHPESVPKAFFWNGLSRLWDIRRPERVLDDVPFEGRTRSVALAGLVVYWPLLLLAVAGLWRNRRRKEIVLPVLAIALAASVVFTAASGTRYRATLEPLIVVLACSAFAPIAVRAAQPAAGRART
jgi:4-amino-4-deoxy-L-arabinose transferase-like glycosyltransferase